METIRPVIVFERIENLNNQTTDPNERYNSIYQKLKRLLACAEKNHLFEFAIPYTLFRKNRASISSFINSTDDKEGASRFCFSYFESDQRTIDFEDTETIDELKQIVCEKQYIKIENKPLFITYKDKGTNHWNEIFDYCAKEAGYSGAYVIELERERIFSLQESYEKKQNLYLQTLHQLINEKAGLIFYIYEIEKGSIEKNDIYISYIGEIVQRCKLKSFDKYEEWSKSIYEENRKKNREYVDDKKLNYCFISEKREGGLCNDGSRKAVFVYLYYDKDVVEYITFLNRIPQYLPLFIITPSQTVSNELTKMMRRKYSIILKQNRGRDISGLLVAAREYILKYDIICFIHDKQGKENDVDRDVEFWRDNLWSNILGKEAYIDNVINYLSTNKRIGLLVPHPPISKRADVWLDNGWSDDYEEAVRVKERLNLEVELDCDGSHITFGTVFWAKTAALKKLFDYQWKYEDFHPEPLPTDGTISHAIERMLGYIAYDAGYDTKIILNTSYADLYLKQIIHEAQNISSAYSNIATEYEELKKRYGYEQYIFKNIIYSFSGALNNDQIEDIESNIARMIEICRSKTRVYVLGTERYVAQVLLMLRYYQIVPEAILNMGERIRQDKMFDIPIVPMNSLDLTPKDTIVLICASHKKAEEMQQVLDLNLCANYFVCKIVM